MLKDWMFSPKIEKNGKNICFHYSFKSVGFSGQSNKAREENETKRKKKTVLIYRHHDYLNRKSQDTYKKYPSRTNKWVQQVCI